MASQAYLLSAVDTRGDVEEGFERLLRRDTQAIACLCLCLLGSVELTHSEVLGALCAAVRSRFEAVGFDSEFFFAKL